MKEITQLGKQSSHMSRPAQINQQQTDLQTLSLSLSLMTAPRMILVVAAVVRFVALQSQLEPL